MKNLIFQTRNLTAILILMAALLSSCATIQFEGDGKNLPPILVQDEIIRPYTAIGKIRIAIEMYVAELPNLQNWGHRILREEAAKLGADAVMLPEISTRPAPHLILPGTEYRAAGVAIKFK